MRTEREMKVIAAELTLLGLDYTTLAEQFGVSRTLVWLAVKGQRSSPKALKIRAKVDKIVAEKGSPVVLRKKKKED